MSMSLEAVALQSLLLRNLNTHLMFDGLHCCSQILNLLTLLVQTSVHGPLIASTVSHMAHVFVVEAPE
jgi:hypothetical protein